MSGLPGYTVVIGDRVATTLAAASTATGFLAGYTERGPTKEPLPVFSITDFENKYGGRLAGHPEVYDAADAAFHEGAAAIYVARTTGTSPVAASKALVDSESKTCLTVTAESVGEWGNGLKVVVTSGGTFTIVVSLGGSTVESSPAFTTVAEAIEWGSTTAEYVNLTAGESTKVPKTQTVELSGGLAKISEATATNLATALTLFNRDLGPGQVAAPQFTEEAGYLALIAHAVANNRRALCDGVNTATQATLITAATALRAAPSKGDRFAAFLAPWAVIPGITPGTTRTIPYSGVQMGVIARADAATGNPNKAAAGVKRGQARYAIGLAQNYSDTQRKELNDAGVSVAILVRGVPTMMGDKTLVAPTTDPNWVGFANSRLIMGVANLAGAVMQTFEFEEIDGRGALFGKLAGLLKGEACMPFYLDDALYGATPAEAFSVNTGPDVNTPTSIAARELKAQIAVRVSPNGEVLTTEVVKVPTTEGF